MTNKERTEDLTIFNYYDDYFFGSFIYLCKK